MKKALAILVAFGLCCSLFGCGGGGSSKRSASKLEGEWYCVEIMSVTGDGTLYQMETITLKPGGKVDYMGMDASWEYSPTEKKITFKANGMTGYMQVEEKNGQTVLTDNYGNLFFRSTEPCAECKKICPGTWQELSSDLERKTMVLQEDGTMTVAGSTYQWRSVCAPDAHYLDIEDYGMVKIDPFGATASVIDGTYYKNNNYTFIEITQDNWNDYFSSDFMQNFDLVYSVENTTVGDQWDQKQIQQVHVIAALKCRENLTSEANGKYLYICDSLIMEYSYETGTQTFTLDSNGEVIPGPVTAESKHRRTDTVNIPPYPWHGPEDCNLPFSIQLACNDISQPVSVQIPKKILRMKGWLIVKDISKLTKPIEPEPEVGIYPGDLCCSAQLPVITSDGISENTVDPTKTGKVTILSFWATQSDAEAEYLAMFDKLTATYQDSVSVFAVHHFPDEGMIPDPVRDGYQNNHVTFLRDIIDGQDGAYYRTLFPEGYGIPMIMILDENGLITEILQYSTDFEALEQAVQKAMN